MLILAIVDWYCDWKWTRLSRSRDARIMSAIPDLMAANLLRIFNERNRRRRAAAIRAIYAEDCFFANGTDSVLGWDGLHDTVDRLQSAHPGFVFQTTGPAVVRHGFAYQRWRFGPREARNVIIGVDVAFFEKCSIKGLIRLN